MHPFEDVQGQVGFTARNFGVCTPPLARDIHSLMRPNAVYGIRF